MLQTKTREIGEHTFAVTQMPGRDAFKMFARLTKLLGPALAEALGKSANLQSILAGSIGDLGAAVTVLCDGLDVRDLDALMDDFAVHTKVSGSNINGSAPLAEMFDIVFAGGGALNLMKWLAFCIEVNFSDFFAALPRAAQSSSEAAAAGVEATPSASPTT